MISRSLASIAVLTLLSTVAHAGSAPKELYGKSISVAWSESITGRPGGDQTTRNWLSVYLMNIYISSVGRPFVRLTMGGAGNSEKARGAHSAGNLSSSTAPDQPSSEATDRVDFQGRSIVVYREFQSGARRIAIDWDGAGCKASVINGRQAGKNIVQQSGGRGQFDVSSIQVGTVSCSVREGNVFGQ
jgi:hypothetical protein